ncbi:CAF17-like 4Fe-4S cluster assembly/insertion protein YgfZ [Falsiroseomonas oryzae]|uniref:CAF17-like 4Fe-4S cluster assembly/insertion protein YgfZ n=1 Tax=Falsiroseomonas oryzae TaxID=2766473 RepID=UPI0022EB6D87|nr:folate-binding protein [Roseomonas sp. MO-31]
MPIAFLPGRGLVEVAGEDRVAFLQGLVSNDVTLAVPPPAEPANVPTPAEPASAPGRAVWAALLTPQGKWLADFFVLAEEARLLLDCARDQAEMLVTTLSRFRLRAKVALRDASPDFAVHAAWGATVPPPGTIAAPDPRLPEAGWRVLAPAPLAADADEAAYDLHRLALGLPDGARDLEPQKSVLLEGGFDELSGVSWSKGCYMGQELTARTRYRGLLKRRLFPVAVEGPLPAPGTPVTRDGPEVGEMRSGRDGLGLALLRIDAVEQGGRFACGDAVLTPRIPGWMKLPAREPA